MDHRISAKCNQHASRQLQPVVRQYKELFVKSLIITVTFAFQNPATHR